MNSCILHSEPSILGLLHYIVTLLIPQILHSYEFEFEILILVVVSYCGVSNMVSWRPLFINTYSNIVLPIIYLFFIYFIPIVIKSSHALFLAVVQKLHYNRVLVSDVFFRANLVLGILKVLTTDFILALRVSSEIFITKND